MDLCHGGVRRSGWVRGRLAAPNTVNRLRRLCNMHAHLRWVPFRTCWVGEEVGRLRRKTSCTSLLLQRFRTTLSVQMDCCPTRDVATMTKKCSRLGGGGEWRRHRLPRSYPAPPSDGTIHAARGEVHLLHCEEKILGSRSAGSYTPRRAGAEPHEPPSGFCIVSFSVMLNRRGARHEPPGHPDTVAFAPHVSDASGGVEGTVVHPLRATTSQRLPLPRQGLKLCPTDPLRRRIQRAQHAMGRSALYAGTRGPAAPIVRSNDARVRSRAQRVANGRPPYC